MAIDYTVIIPAYNEELHLPETLNCLNASMTAVNPLSGEVIVVDNNSKDHTAAIARAHGCRVVFEAHNQISRARNCGAAVALGRYLIFLDADTLISPEVLQKALSLLASGKYYGGGAKVAFSEDVPGSALFSIKLWNWLAQYRKWVAGCFIFCLEEAFNATGGFREDIYAAEEIYFARAMLKWGTKKKLAFAFIDSQNIKTSPRKVKIHSMTFLLSIMLILGAFPFLLKFKRMCRIWYNR